MFVLSKLSAALQKSLLPIIVLATFIFASAANTQQIYRDQGYQVPNSGNVQKQLYALTFVTQNLVENAGRFKQLNPALATMLNNQLLSIQDLSPEELNSLAAAVPELIELRKQVVELNNLLTERMLYAGPEYDGGLNTNMTGFIADGWKVGCPIGGGALYGNAETILHTPGPCGQDGLFDAGYPYICPFSTPAEVLIISRITLAIAKTIASSIEKICFQSVFGNNTSTGCIALEVIRLVLLGILDTLANCNDKRGAAETFGTYVRTGDIFVANSQNFGLQHNKMQVTLGQVMSTEIALTGNVTTARGKIDDALEDGFSGTETLLTSLETLSILNAHRLDRILARQRLIMRELGIESRYRDPNTNPGSGSAYSSDAVSRDRPKVDAGSEFRIIETTPGRARK